MTDAFTELEARVRAALETYSNVHRGSGHHSRVTTRLYEQAREIVLARLGLDGRRHVVIFCSPARAEVLQGLLPPGRWKALSSADIGLPLGLRALAVARGALPGGAPPGPGGGTARLVGPDWVVWAKDPDRFEAGTPAIVNVIAFAVALRLLRRDGDEAFLAAPPRPLTAAEILEPDGLEGLAGPALLAALRPSRIGRDARVPTVAGPAPFVNLDNAASTPTFEPIWDAARRSWRLPAPERPALVREVARRCAGFLGADEADYEVLFTANTTEAIHLVAESRGRSQEPDIEPVVLNTLLEHNSNELPWDMLPGHALVRLPVDGDGFVDLELLAATLRAYNQDGAQGRRRIRLVAVSGASNVLGTANDLAAIARLAHEQGAELLVDAAQLVAHRPVRMTDWDLDYLAFSAHKAYAPFGTGVLVARRGLLRLDDPERARLRASGEENIGGIAALGMALGLLRRIGMETIQAEEQALTARALRGLAAIPKVTVYGLQDPDSPRFARRGGVIAFNLDGAMAPATADELAARAGIGLRAGCHCAHLLVKRVVHVGPRLERFQRLIVSVFPRLSLPGVTRASLGLENTAEDVDTLVRALTELAAEPRRRVARGLRGPLDDYAAAAAARVYGVE